jgi:hypothetical protein
MLLLSHDQVPWSLATYIPSDIVLPAVKGKLNPQF